MKESKIDEILFGTFHSFFIGANVTAFTHDIKPLALGTLGGAIGATKNLMKDETNGNKTRYLGLIEKTFK